MGFKKFLPWAGLALTILQGCTAVGSFTTAARPGDTVALATGWNQPVNRTNIGAQFTDANGAVVSYEPGNAGIRTVVQLYPDPVSKLMVEYATGQSPAIGMPLMNGPLIGSYINDGYTANDADWNQTVVYLDLPASLAVGMANISLNGPSGALTAAPIKVNVLAGTGNSNKFTVQGGGSAGSSLPLLQRQSYYTVSFTSSTIPYSIQLDLIRPASTAIPWVVNTRGDLKNVAWHDDGASNLRVMLSPSHGAPLGDMKHFKFYVASGIPLAGLTAGALKAYDASGYPVSGVTANVTFTP